MMVPCIYAVLQQKKYQIHKTVVNEIKNVSAQLLLGALKFLRKLYLVQFRLCATLIKQTVIAVL